MEQEKHRKKVSPKNSLKKNLLKKYPRKTNFLKKKFPKKKVTTNFPDRNALIRLKRKSPEKLSLKFFFKKCCALVTEKFQDKFDKNFKTETRNFDIAFSKNRKTQLCFLELFFANPFQQHIYAVLFVI